MKVWIGQLALTLAAIVLTFAALELGLRLAHDGPRGLSHWPNLVVQARSLSLEKSASSRAVHDPRVGFIGRPGYRSQDGALAYDERGLRITPAPPGIALAEPPVLVVGDSFAHGDDVRNEETWPARLQALTGRRVMNAAMSGYGIDQMVLRAGVMSAVARPAAIVMSFIADDVRRAEMKRVWGMEKPYFDVIDGVPAERNVPVPPSPRPEDTLNIWQRLFGWSALLDRVLQATGWHYEWVIDHERVLPSGTGERLACPLFQRLASIGVPVLVVAEYDSYHWQDDDWRQQTRRIDDAVLACAKAARLATLDLFETMDAAVRQHGLPAIFQRGHPTALATAIVAERIAAEMQGLLK